MALYTKKDIEYVKESWPIIKSEVEEKRIEKMIDFNKNEIKKIRDIILEYVKKHKRKLYGGFALHLLVSSKDKSDALYNESNMGDFDIYSPEPISDVCKICDLLYKNGFKHISGFEAQHTETYTIKVDGTLFCDVSYVPPTIYNRIPFIDIDGYTVSHPNWLSIDYLRMLIDPLISYWRFDADLKGLRRFLLLQKHYKLPHNITPIALNNPSQDTQKPLGIIKNFVTSGKKSIVNIGLYAYNVFVDSSKHNKIKNVNVPYYEFLSTDYVNDVTELLKELSTIDGITHVEYYPYFQFTGYSVEILHNNKLVARIITNNKKCIPYLQLDKKYNNSIIGSFHTVLLFALVYATKYRADKDEVNKNLYYAIVSNLIEMRDHFYKTNKEANLLSKTIFKEFIIDCLGDTISPENERELLIASRKKKNITLTFRYKPEEKKSYIYKKDYNYVESSGLKINKTKNLRLSKENNAENDAYVEADDDAEETKEKDDD
jgi:hypothetical protein